MEIVITEFTENGVRDSDDMSSIRLVCRMKSGEKIVFWGSPEDGTRNIDALKGQRLPCVVEIDPKDVIPSDYLKEKYGVTYKVSEHTWIQINPER